MARLPTPGGDDGLWGNLLNEYLAVAHNADGTLKNSTVGMTQLDSAVTTAISSAGAPQYRTLPYSHGGALGVAAGAFRLYNDSGATWTIQGVRASVGTAPTGASVIIDVNVDGTTIFTTQGNRPAIAVSGTTSGNVTNMNTTTVAAGSYLTVDIDQVGSTIAGADLCVQIGVK